MTRDYWANPITEKAVRYIAGITLLVAATIVLVAASPPWTAPARAAKKKNPLATDQASLATGRELYKEQCFSCHGTKGLGDGPGAKDLERSAGNLADPKLWQQSDGELFWKITEGSKPMPTFRDLLTEEQRWQVVNYVRTLAKKP